MLAGGTIRLATPEDALATSEIYEPIVQGSCISFEAEPTSAEQMGGRIRETLEWLP